MNNTKKFNLNKKIVAILLILFTLLSNVSPIFAASGTGSWVAGQFASFIHTTDNPNTKYGVLLRRLVNANTNESRTVFCSQHGVDIDTGVINKGRYYTPTNATVKKCCKIAYFGWYDIYGDYVVNGGTSDDTKLRYVLTQQYIWETLGQSNATFVNSSHQSAYVAFKNEINNKISNMEKTPSFDSTTIELDAGDTYTATDSNHVLSDYKSIDKTVSGIRFQHTQGENTLKITVSQDCNIESLKVTDATTLAWGLIKDGTEDHDTTVYFEFEDDAQEQLYALHYNDPVTMAFSLKINLFGKLELTKLNTNKDLVDGAVFTVNGPGYNGDVTVKNGKILLEQIKKGTYTIKEKSVGTGYLLNTESYKAEVKSNQTTTQAIVNNEPTGEISLVKTDKDTGNSNRIDGTSHHGDVNLKGTEYTFYAKEDIYNVARTVKYFSKNEEIAKFTFDEYGKATVIVTNKTTSAKLSVDGDTIKGLPMGTYYAKETHVVEGYMQDTQEHTYTLSYKDMNTPVIKTSDTLKNTVQKAKFEVIKISSNTNTTAPVIANAEFTAILTKYVDYYGSFDEALKHLDKYAEDEYSIFKTGADGHGVSGLLAYGEYTVEETYTPNDEIETVEPFYIKIDRNSNGVIKEYVENDAPFESYLKMIKIDKNTGKKVTFSNATFKLYRLNENNEWEKVKCKTGLFSTDKWKTDKTGLAVTEDKLKAGTYKIDEIELPTGFLQLEKELTFKINKSNKTLEFDEDYDAYITITVGNEQPTGTLQLDKSVAIRQDVDTSLVDISNLSKIKFKLTAKEKIIDYADGSTIYEKGQEVGQYNLTKEGKLEVKKLPMGKYELEEIETLKGLVLDTTKYEIVFKQKDTTTKVYTHEEKLINDTTAVEFSKTDITGESELEGAKLTIFDKDNNIIDSWTSSTNTHKIEGLTAGESYILREEIAPDGFVRATDIEFKVENTKEIQKVTMIDKIVEMTKKDVAGDELEGAKIKVFDKDGKVVDEWTSTKESHKINNLVENETYTLHEEITPNGYVKATDIEFTVSADKETQHIEMIDKIVEMSKKNIGGEEIEGAEIKVFDKEGNIVDEWTSTKEPHIINNLVENETYTLHEEIAPNGYVKATDIEFTVSTDKETQHIEMIDKIVEMSKKNIGGEEIEGAEIKVFDKEGNIVDEWTSTKEPHIINNLVENETYTLHEEVAPNGYVKATDIEFTVSTDKETQHIEMIDKVVDVTKTDLVDGKEVEGAELVITDKDGNVIDEWTSTKEPHHITGLEEGKTYTLTEKTAPYGYEITESIEFTVSTDKETQHIEMKDMPILRSVQVEKLDKATREHIKSNKFEFGIYEDAKCTKLIKKAGANEYEGTALFDGLRFGTYYIKEIKAPLGYKLSDQIVKVEINDKGVFADGVSLEEKDSVYSFVYYNSLLPAIQTGNETNYILLASLAAISLIGIVTGIVVLKKKRNN